MTDIVCYIKNEVGKNELVTSREQVNSIVKERILKLTGGIENELRNLRQGIVNMWIVDHPKMYSKSEVDIAYKAGEELFKLNDEIEKIIKEGQDIKALLRLEK